MKKRIASIRSFWFAGLVGVLSLVGRTHAEVWRDFVQFRIQVDNRDRLRIDRRGNWQVIGDDSRDPYGLCDGNTKQGVAFDCMTNYSPLPPPAWLDDDLRKWDASVIDGTSPRCPNIGEGSNPGSTVSVIEHTDDFIVIYFRDDGECGSSGRVRCTVRVRYLAPSAPAIVQEPADLTVRQGDPTELSVQATGGALHYAWRKDGIPLATAGAARLEIPSARLRDAGVYDVVISNPVGSVVSRPARLEVLPLPISLSVRQLSPGWAEISWSSSAGDGYVLEWTQDFKSWASAGNRYTGTGGQIAVRVPVISDFAEYYRLAIVP